MGVFTPYEKINALYISGLQNHPSHTRGFATTTRQQLASQSPRFRTPLTEPLRGTLPARQQLASARTPLAALAPAPSTVSCVPLTRNLSPADPSPCPCPGVDTPRRSNCCPRSRHRHHRRHRTIATAVTAATTSSSPPSLDHCHCHSHHRHFRQ